MIIYSSWQKRYPEVLYLTQVFLETRCIQIMKGLIYDIHPPYVEVAANEWNKDSWTAYKEWSSSLGVMRGDKNSSLWKTSFLLNVTRSLELAHRDQWWAIVIFRVSQKARNLLTRWVTARLSRGTRLHGMGYLVTYSRTY